MKRREFLVSSSTGIAALALPGVGHSADPCPPPGIWVAGGTTASSPCTSTVIGPAPGWFLSAPEGVWMAIAGDRTIQKVLPSPVPSNPGSHPGNITAAWTGAGVDQVRGEYLMCANGGHADYPGNECYAISVRDDVPGWRRLTDPTPQSHITFDSNVNSQGVAVYADGRPRAMHSTFECYGDGRVWFPQQNSFTSPSGNGTQAVLSFNRDALGAGTTPLPWTGSNLGPWTIHGNADFGGYTNTGFGRAAWDRVGRKVWAVGGNNNISASFYWSVETAGATLGQIKVYRSPSPLDNFNSWVVIAPDLRIMVLGGAFGKLWVFYLDKAGQSGDWQQITNFTGTGFFQSGAGGAYVAANHTIGIGNPKNTGSDMYKLRIPTKISDGQIQYDSAGTWAWSKSSVGGVTVTVPPEGNNDTYSKWSIVDDMGNGQAAIIVLTQIDGPVYMYKVPRSGL